LNTDKILIVPKVDYQPHDHYHIQALLLEERLYEMYISRLECGSVDYMTIDHELLLKKMYKSYSLESSVNNDSFRLKESTGSNYYSSKELDVISSCFNYYDTS
jgi:hypothetical protein